MESLLIEPYLFIYIINCDDNIPNNILDRGLKDCLPNSPRA